MCIFSGTVESVSTTKIFCNRTDTRQNLVYQMSLSAPRDLAMILPLPCLDDEDDPIKFVNLSRYRRFFPRLEELYRTPPGGTRKRAAAKRSLVVHQVGAYEASFVPSLRDFSRLDPRFKLPPSIWRKLPEYKEWGFAVFKFAAGTKHKSHPFGLSFQPSWDDHIFFPTVHVHDKTVPSEAHFDHTLYTQVPKSWEDPHAWQKSRKYPKNLHSMIRTGSRIFKHRLLGTLPNCDHWIQSDGEILN